MTIRLSRAEYWLLDVAVQDSVPIAGLINGSTATFLNRTNHNSSPEELTEALERLFANRFIKSFKPKSPRRYRFLTPSEIKTELRRPKLPSSSKYPLRSYFNRERYQLTPAGGTAWESFARPDWTRFMVGVNKTLGPATYDKDKDPPYRCHGYIICPTLSRVDLYLSQAPHIGHKIEINSIRRDTISPWKATYWKILPLAHRARFRMTYHSIYVENHGWTPEALNTFELFDSWYRWRS